MVVPTGNADAPVHRWFHLKEAYSKDLLATLLRFHPEIVPAGEPFTIVDPFTGVGTTLVSALDLQRSGVLKGVRGYGLEINPFLRFVASTKVRSCLTPTSLDLDALMRISELAMRHPLADVDRPALSTFQNARYFPPAHVDQLVQLRLAITESELDQMHRDWAMLALAMAIEPASRLRRDGRALRYEDRLPIAPVDVFQHALKRIGQDLPHVAGVSSSEVEIHYASAAEPWGDVPAATADLVLFSPPYPNNIDYTEVYKIELWGLGYVRDREEFRNQRHRTLRSHPSVKFTRKIAFECDPRADTVRQLIGPVIEAIPEGSRYAAKLHRMVGGYADDMLQTFDSAFAALRPGGHCVYVVGNSVHGTVEDPVIIASDVMLGRLAELARFEVVSLYIARDLPRRRISSPFVRESVAVLRKPA